MKIFCLKNSSRSFLASLLVLTMSVGCGRAPGNVPVNQSVAREACKAFLEAWENGETPEDLQPKIIGSDYVWASGQTLVSFEILDDEKNNGSSLRVSAQLDLRDSKGRESKSKASYIVGTSPVITVIRDES